MGLGDLVDGVEKVVGGVVEVGKEIVMAPAEIAHWALTQMFGGGEADLKKIAAELDQLGKELETLSKDMSTTVSHLTWHGPASDAFVQHAQGRVKELNGVSDGLHTLSKDVTRLANVY
ncbi:WXG100 family type VII secretion target [Streptomyces sp. NPDC059740]|uniref:WXG100 family type VII secretion target n=1 Tax=Streptomyces sp. NPDC059740 TaxID=3346926 RepID=UPI00364740A6